MWNEGQTQKAARAMMNALGPQSAPRISKYFFNLTYTTTRPNTSNFLTKIEKKAYAKTRLLQQIAKKTYARKHLFQQIAIEYNDLNIALSKEKWKQRQYG